MDLSKREKEMIGVSIAIAAGSQSCTAHHIQAARACGVTEIELSDFIDLALTVRIQATRFIAQVGREQLSGVEKVVEKDMVSQSLIKSLARVGAADTVNYSSALSFHLTEARRHGATNQQLKTTFELVATIKNAAAATVKKIGVEFQIGEAMPTV